LRDDGDGDEGEAVQDSGGYDTVELRGQHSEGEHDDRRRQREPDPRRDGARISGALESHEEPDLTAGGSGQHLGEGDEAGVLVAREPAALADVGALEVAQVGDRAAE
jgi:hypothetical protein